MDMVDGVKRRWRGGVLSIPRTDDFASISAPALIAAFSWARLPFVAAFNSRFTGFFSIFTQSALFSSFAMSRAVLPSCR